MNKNALIINPWVCDFKLYDEWMHPVGLYFLISLLKKNNYEIRYVNFLEREDTVKNKRFGTGDFLHTTMEKHSVYGAIPRSYKRYGITEDEAVRRLSEVPEPAIIFIGTGMTYWIDGVCAAVTLATRLFPHIPVILGGIGAGLMETVYRKRFPDIRVFSGSLHGRVDELSHMHESLAPLSEYDWTPNLYDGFTVLEKLYHAPVLTSFGCPFQCSYCASSFLYAGYASRPMQVIIDEIAFCAERKAVTDFAFYDDALLYRAQTHFIPLVKRIRDIGFNVRFHLPNGLHIRFITRDIAQEMKAAGFSTIRLGYETTDKKFRHHTGLKIRRKETVEKILILKDAGFLSSQIGVYIMAGLPGQSADDVVQEMEFIASLGVLIKLVLLSPVPNTELFKYYQTSYPLLATEPLHHNDLFFITQLPGWDYGTVQFLRDKAKAYNKNIIVYT